MNLMLRVPRITAFLAFTLVFLTACHLLGLYSKHALGRPSAFGLVHWFSFQQENNIPTWYSSQLLMTCSVLLGLITMVERRRDRRNSHAWLALSIIFVLLSLDEVSSIHERVPGLPGTPNGTGIFYFHWVGSGTLIVVVFVAAYSRFLWRLPARSRILFIVAGAIYVGGALGMESIDGAYASAYGKDSLTYDLLATLEEFLEMTGASIFIYTLLAHLRDFVPPFRLGLEEAPVGANAIDPMALVK